MFENFDPGRVEMTTLEGWGEVAHHEASFVSTWTLYGGSARQKPGWFPSALKVLEFRFYCATSISRSAGSVNKNLKENDSATLWSDRAKGSSTGR